jgi:hypothetical protein
MSAHVGGAMPLGAQSVIELALWENEGGPSLPTAHPVERLDWASFLARFYPHARSHDYESLAAYIEYQKASGTDVADVRSVVRS